MQQIKIKFIQLATYSKVLFCLEKNILLVYCKTNQHMQDSQVRCKVQEVLCIECQTLLSSDSIF